MNQNCDGCFGQDLPRRHPAGHFFLFANAQETLFQFIILEGGGGGNFWLHANLFMEFSGGRVYSSGVGITGIHIDGVVGAGPRHAGAVAFCQDF